MSHSIQWWMEGAVKGAIHPVGTMTWVYQPHETASGWWWLEPWNFMTFHIYWECHHPNFYSLHHGHQRARWLNHQAFGSDPLPSPISDFLHKRADEAPSSLVQYWFNRWDVSDVPTDVSIFILFCVSSGIVFPFFSLCIPATSATCQLGAISRNHQHTGKGLHC